MKTIEQTIQELAEGYFPTYSYVFETWQDADTQLERLSFPAIVCVVPVSGSTSIKHGKVYDTENVAIAFLDAATRDADGKDNAEVYNRMKMAGAKFIRALNATKQYEPIGNAPYQTICEQMATIVTGVMYTLTIKQELGECDNGEL